MADNMTNRQSWAIFTNYGYDVRDTDISFDEASNLISASKNQDQQAIAENLQWLSEIEGAVKKRESAKPKKDWQAIYDLAHKAGHEAATGMVPEPMTVVERANPLDDNSEIVKQYEPIADGVCGFAWINVKPGNSSFANWLKKNDLARKDSYYGGVTIWVGDYNQSYEKKMAYAGAFAKVLKDSGIEKAYASGRLD